MYDKPIFLPTGDQALMVEMGDRISDETNIQVRNLTLALEKLNLPGIISLLPTYTSLLISYDSMIQSSSNLQSRIEDLQDGLTDHHTNNHQILNIPTLYGGEYGPDLEFVASHTGISVDEVVNIHSATKYRVHMMGFTPGFPYLGGLPEQLTTPRLDTPRIAIPAGSVGIADNQTGFYPISSPGGWRLIGRTPLKMFDPEIEPPSILAVGDYVQFTSIDTEKEYLEMKKSIDSGNYELKLENDQ